MEPEDFFKKAARPFGLAAAMVLVFMMLLTAYAVVARQFFDVQTLGLVEMSEYALVACIFIAMPGAFLRDDNIVVDVVDHVVPRSVIYVLRQIGLLLTIAFLGLTAVAMIKPALIKFHREQTTLVLEINLFYYWIPILFGFFLATAATVWLFVHRLINGIRSDNAPADPK